MTVRFREGSMPTGGTYEEFAELLARLYRTFEPLKERGGEDEKDFVRITAALDLFAVRHGVADPRTHLEEQDWLAGYATPFEALESVSAIVRDFGLCHPQGDRDDQSRTTIARTFLNVLQRYRAIDAAFAPDAGSTTPVGVARWLKPDSTPMEKIFGSRLKERKET